MINDYEATEPMTTDAVPVTGAAGYAGTNQASLSNDDVIDTLNNLIETCRDGQEGFKDAAEAVKDSQLKTLFYEYSQQRAQFSAVLMELVRELGGDPTHSGSTAGAMHRGWIELKSAITGGSDEATSTSVNAARIQQRTTIGLPSNAISRRISRMSCVSSPRQFRRPTIV
jgi:hypothetical protein